MQKDYSKYLKEDRKISKNLKFIIIGGIILLLIIFLVVIPSIKKAKESALKKEAQEEKKKNFAIPVKVEQISKETILDTIITNADIEGIEKNNIYSDYLGKIVKVYVKEGQLVRRGQIVAKFNRDIVVKRFEDTPLKTLISGIVGKIYLDLGDTVSPQAPIMTIENISKVKCITKITEKDISRIKLGNKAIVKVDAYPNIEFEGIVKEISPVLDPMSRSTDVKIIVSNHKYKTTPLRPGMYAEVKIIVNTFDEMLLTPYSSVLKDEANKHYIYLFRNNLARKVYITPGLTKNYGEDTSKDRIQISGNIEENEFVVVMGHQFLNNGDKIRFTYKDKKYGPEGVKEGFNSEKAKKIAIEKLNEYMISLKTKLVKEKDFDTLNKYAQSSFMRAFFFSEKEENKKKYALDGLQAAEQVLKMEPGKPHGHYWVGMMKLILSGVAYKSGDMPGAMKQLTESKKLIEKSLDIDDEFFEGGAHRTLGALHFRVPMAPFDKSKAIPHLEKAVKAGPKNRWNYSSSAEIYFAFKQYDKARNAVDKGIAIPINKEIAYLENEAMVKLKEIDKKLIALKK